MKKLKNKNENELMFNGRLDAEIRHLKSIGIFTTKEKLLADVNNKALILRMLAEDSFFQKKNKLTQQVHANK